MTRVKGPSRPRVAAAALCALGVWLAATAPASAALYALAPDGVLADEAPVIAELRIEAIQPARWEEPPMTRYRAAVQRVLKGSLPATVTIAVPGGERPDGVALVLPGVPVFERGERLLLFLLPHRDGSYDILDLAAGAFRIRPRAGRAVAERDLDAAPPRAPADPPQQARRRDYERFSAWLRDRARGERREPDYFESVTPLPGPSRPAYGLITQAGTRVRWFEFDDGTPVSWELRAADAVGELDAFAFQSAMQLWNADEKTPVLYTYSGEDPGDGGLTRTDGVNSVIFGNPNHNRLMGSRVRCRKDGLHGLLAIGGVWTVANETGVFNETVHRRVLEADVVVNRGVRCWLETWGRRGALYVFAHELGHTLGIDHSRVQAALMYPRPRGKNLRKGAFLRADDRKALRALYEEKLVRPTALEARSTSQTKGRLTWHDNSSNEEAFEIWLRIGDGAWQPWETVPADRESLRFKGATPGATYRFKVRGRKGELTSKFSNVARVTMPESLKRPTHLQATASSTTRGSLSWHDNSNNETDFELWIKVGGGAWHFWLTKPANTVGMSFANAEPGATYRFKVRARKISQAAEAAAKKTKVSKWSNVARLTMPIGRRDCGDFTCRADYACCVRARTCCPATHPHYCPNVRKCYSTFDGAQAACGLNYEICGGPLGARGDGSPTAEQIFAAPQPPAAIPFPVPESAFEAAADGVSPALCEPPAAGADPRPLPGDPPPS